MFSDALRAERHKKLILIMIGSCLLATASCARINALKKNIVGRFTSKQITPPPDAKVTDPQKMAFFTAKKGRIANIHEIRGKLQAGEKIEIRASKRIRIGPAKFKLYEKIKRGDVLFAVDTKELETKREESKERVEQLKVDIQSANASLEFARKQLDRKKVLVAKGISAQKELDEAQKAFVSAETQQKTKDLELRKADRELLNATETVETANIISPMDGIVTSIVPGGDEVNQSQSVAAVANPASLLLSVEVGEAVVSLLKKGTTVAIKFDAVPDRAVQGKIKTSIASVKQSGISKTYEVQIEIDSAEVKTLNLRDGYEAMMTASFGEKSNVVAVPLSAIKMNGNESFVLVASAKGSIPAARAVKIGMRTELEAEVVEGVREGDIVAVFSSDGEGSQ